MNISTNKENSQTINIKIEEFNIHPIDSGLNEKTIFYERFQKENIDFIKTLLRLKTNSPNNYFNTDNNNTNTKLNAKAYSPNEKIKDCSNRFLLLNHYPKPYQPQISSSSSNPKRTKSLIRTSDITTINSKEKQKCFLAPLFKQQIQSLTNKEKTAMISYTSSNHKTCIKPKYTKVIQRTNSSSAINQPSISTATSITNNNNNNKNERSSSLNHSKKKRMSVGNLTTTTTTTRTRSCIARDKKTHPERAKYNIKKSNCNVVSIFQHKKREHSSLMGSHSNTSEPKIMQKAIMIEKQRPNIPIAEIDLDVEVRNENNNTNSNEAKKNNNKRKERNNDNIKSIFNNLLLSNNTKKHLDNKRKINNKSFYDVKSIKHSLSFIEKTPLSPQLTDNTNKTSTIKQSSYKFEKKKKQEH